MNNFEMFKKNMTPERVATSMRCGECPLYRGKCEGFSSLGSANPLKECVDALVAWFKEEA